MPIEDCSRGTVYDGSDAAASVGDVVIRGDRIVYVGPHAQARFDAARSIPAAGRIVAPGFIDPHIHPDEAGKLPLASRWPALSSPS